MPVARRCSIQSIDIVILIGIIFYTNFVIKTREHIPPKIQHAAGIIHQVITSTFQAISIEPHRFGIGHHCNERAVTIKRIPQLLSAYPTKRSRKMLDFISTHYPPHLCIASTKISTHAAHGTQRGSFNSSKSHRRIHPGQVTQMQKIMRSFNPKVNLVHLSKSCRCLVSSTSPHIRKKSINIYAVRQTSRYRQSKFLIHLRSAITDGNLHRLVPMRFDRITTGSRICIWGKRFTANKKVRIPDWQRFDIHAKNACRKQKKSQTKMPGHESYLSLGSTIN